MNSIYDAISQTNPTLEKIVGPTIEWRDETSAVNRKIVCGIALTFSGLTSLIDAVVSLALAIITSPLELGGIRLARSFAKRTFFNGLLGGLELTIANYDNIREEKLGEKLDSRFS